MATLEITTQTTNDPDVLKFVASRLLSANKATGFYQSGDANDCEPVTAMFDVAGVSGVMLVNNFCIVKKTPTACWDSIIPEIERIIHSGWSG